MSHLRSGLLADIDAGQMIGNTFSWVGHHQWVFSLLFSFVVALATVAYVRLTGRLVEETRELRQLETAPNLAVYLESNAQSPNLLDIVIQNTGRVEARKVTWRVQADIVTLRERRALVLPELHLFRDGINALFPGQQIRSFFASTIEVLQEPILKPIEVTAFYEYGQNQHGTATFLLAVEEFLGLEWINQTSVEDSLKRVADVLEGVRGRPGTAPWYRVYVTTAQERELEKAWLRRVGRRGWRGGRTGLRQRLRQLSLKDMLGLSG